MPRRTFKPRERRSNVRDARLIVIAAEGTNTEPTYFNALARDNRFRNPKVHVEVLKRDSTASSPVHVIAELDKFRNDYSLNDNDELWLVIDVDRWTAEMLSDVAKQAVEKLYDLAVSNPCFEIWLLLHLTDLTAHTDEEREALAQNKKDGDKTRLEQALAVLCGGYNKSKLNVDLFLPHVEAAINRARARDVNPEQRWTNHLGTRVYLLAASITRTTHR